MSLVTFLSVAPYLGHDTFNTYDFEACSNYVKHMNTTLKKVAKIANLKFVPRVSSDQLTGRESVGRAAAAN